MSSSIWSKEATTHFKYWLKHDRKKALKILNLIKEAESAPGKGKGRPELLKHDLHGHWSRQIDREHRLVYRVIANGKLRIVSCRFHYDKGNK